MASYPVIERELLSRARWGLTPWIRVLVVLIAGLMVIPLLNVALQAPGTRALGPVVLGRLGWFIFALCLLEGVRQTADAISLEAREGTLGLLLLTDLSGWDVTLGKLSAASLNGFYSMLATVPVLGLSLALGGVTPGEFWRTQLGLVSTLFLSLCCGLWVSGRGLEHHRNLIRAITILVGLCLVPLILTVVPVLSWLPCPSPVMLVSSAADSVYSAEPRRFWASFLMIVVIGVLMLANTARRLHGFCQRGAWEISEEAQQGKGIIRILIRIWQSLRTRRVALGELNPVAWLMSRERQQLILIWLAAVVPVLVGAAVFVLQSLLGASFAVGAWSLIPRVMAGLLWAVVGSRTFANAKRGGALELMLTTPLTPAEMVDGHWQALWGQLRVPMLATAIGGTVFQMMTQIFSGSGQMRGVSGFLLLYQLSQPALQVLQALTICWVASWLGLKARTPALAVGLSTLIGMGVPWLLGALLPGVASLFLTVGLLGQVQDWYWIPWLLGQFLQIACSGLLVWWSYRRLLTRFREAAAGDEARARRAAQGLIEN